MARSVQMTYPLDQPHISRRGYINAEDDAPGNAKWLTIPASDPIRAKKGDLGLEHIRDFESRALTGPLPWVNLRGGK